MQHSALFPFETRDNVDRMQLSHSSICFRVAFVKSFISTALSLVMPVRSSSIAFHLCHQRLLSTICERAAIPPVKDYVCAVLYNVVVLYLTSRLIMCAGQRHYKAPRRRAEAPPWFILIANRRQVANTCMC